MGASQSKSGVSVDQLKNQVFGAAVFMLSQRLDSELSFVKPDQFSQEQPHTLPTTQTTELPGAVIGYYGNDAEVDMAIEHYLNEHILDTPEHYQQFVDLLVNKLRPNRLDTMSQHSRAPRAPVPEELEVPGVHRPIVKRPRAHVPKISHQIDQRVQRLASQIEAQRPVEAQSTTRPPRTMPQGVATVADSLRNASTHSAQAPASTHSAQAPASTHSVDAARISVNSSMQAQEATPQLPASTAAVEEQFVDELTEDGDEYEQASFIVNH